jgi:hypothetical protein
MASSKRKALALSDSLSLSEEKVNQRTLCQEQLLVGFNRIEQSSHIGLFSKFMG